MTNTALFDGTGDDSVTRTFARDLQLFGLTSEEITRTLKLIRPGEPLQEEAVYISLNSGAYSIGAPADAALILIRREWESIANREKIELFYEFMTNQSPPGPGDESRVEIEIDEEIRSFLRDSNTGNRKPVFVPQHDEMDCGAACMSMIAHYYGKKLTVPHYRSKIHVTREGASMLALKKAAEQTGFDAVGIYCGLNPHLLKVRTPFVALMDYHFVVVYSVSETGFLIGDPAVGLRTVPLDDLKKSWSKFILLLKPNSEFEHQKESLPTYKKYYKVFKGVELQLIDIGVASFLSLGLGVIIPLFMQRIFDRVFVEKSSESLAALVIASISATLIATTLGWIRTYLFAHLSTRLDSKFSALFMRHTLSLPAGFFAVRRVGDFTTRVQELATLRNFFTGELLSLLMALASAILYSVLSALYHWKIPVLVFGLLSFQVIFALKVSKKISELYQEVFKSSAKAQSTLYEHISSVETLKALNHGTPARWRWEEDVINSLRNQKKMGSYSAISTGSSEFFRESALNICIFLCLHLYLKAELSLGQVVAVTALVGNITPSVVYLVQSLTTISQIRVSLARVDDVITSSPEELSTQAGILSPDGPIDFDQVCFQYGTELSPQVIRNVTLRIEPGETVAFVGPSGSGKTTLAHMISLLYRPTTGSIRISGTDVTSVSLDHLRSHIGMVLQENNLFSGTIFENITLGDPAPSRDRAKRAAEVAQIHDHISGLPLGYEQILEAGGAGLSMGQKQRISIARALYRNPSILILDEATSALDGITEKKIVQSLSDFRRGLTTIVIAHRLSTISTADRIFVFEKGSLVEQGAPEHLFRQQGRFFDLFRNQIPS
jgi:subfamily B ATP-binding cassette protein HlyB/CyaB